MGAWKDKKRDAASLKKQLDILIDFGPITAEDFGKKFWPDSHAWKKLGKLHIGNEFVPKYGVILIQHAKKLLNILVEKGMAIQECNGPTAWDTTYNYNYVPHREILEYERYCITNPDGTETVVIGPSPNIYEPEIVKVQVCSRAELVLVYNCDRSVIYQTEFEGDLVKLFPKEDGYPNKKYFEYTIDNGTIVLGKEVTWREW